MKLAITLLKRINDRIEDLFQYLDYLFKDTAVFWIALCGT